MENRLSTNVKEVGEVLDQVKIFSGIPPKLRDGEVTHKGKVVILTDWDKNGDGEKRGECKAIRDSSEVQGVEIKADGMEEADEQGTNKEIVKGRDVKAYAPNRAKDQWSRILELERARSIIGEPRGDQLAWKLPVEILVELHEEKEEVQGGHQEMAGGKESKRAERRRAAMKKEEGREETYKRSLVFQRETPGTRFLPGISIQRELIYNPRKGRYRTNLSTLERREQILGRSRYIHHLRCLSRESACTVQGVQGAGKPAGLSEGEVVEEAVKAREGETDIRQDGWGKEKGGKVGQEHTDKESGRKRHAKVRSGKKSRERRKEEREKASKQGKHNEEGIEITWKEGVVKAVNHHSRKANYIVTEKVRETRQEVRVEKKKKHEIKRLLEESVVEDMLAKGRKEKSGMTLQCKEKRKRRAEVKENVGDLGIGDREEKQTEGEGQPREVNRQTQQKGGIEGTKLKMSEIKEQNEAERGVHVDKGSFTESNAEYQMLETRKETFESKGDQKPQFQKDLGTEVSREIMERYNEKTMILEDNQPNENNPGTQKSKMKVPGCRVRSHVGHRRENTMDREVVEVKDNVNPRKEAQEEGGQHLKRRVEGIAKTDRHREGKSIYKRATRFSG